MNKFHHSGDFGDIIYSLPTIRALGGGILQLGVGKVGTRLAMLPQRADIIKPLLLEQPYIDDVVYGNDLEDVTHNLDNFRYYWEHREWNIAQAHLYAFNQDFKLCEEPWLTVPDPVTIAGKPIVINRPWDRHHNPKFPWHKLLNDHAQDAVFVGLPVDYENFENTFKGGVPYLPTDNLLDAAQVLAGCTLFIGAQSAPFAIIEALKKDAILEVYEAAPNCLFTRPNVRHLPLSE